MQSHPRTNIVEIAQERAVKDAHRVAFTFSDSDDTETQLTYLELDTRARAIAANLLLAGLSGKRALLLYLPGFDYLCAFYGCLYAGVAAVPAYPPDPSRLGRTLPRLLNIIKDSQSAAVLTTQAIEDMAGNLFSTGEHDPKLKWLSTDVISDTESKKYVKPRVQSSDLAFLQYTSGSTSQPRGVMLSHDNIVANMDLIMSDIGFPEDTRAVSWLPPYHDMGLIGGMIQPVYRGFPALLMSPLDFLSNPFKWLKAMSDTKATASAGPNFAYDLCVRRVTDEEIATIDLSSWKIAVNGAEPVRSDTLQRFYERFSSCGFRMQTFIPSYGLAESTLYVCGASNKNGPSVIHVDKAALEKGKAEIAASSISTSRSLVGCGKPASELTIRIVDRQTGTTLPENQIGEVWMSHPSVSNGYWNQPEKNKDTFGLKTREDDKSFMRGGDLGFIYKGELFITGRSKDLIIIRGRNHYPQDIEETLEHCHDNIRPGCLAAFAVDTDHGEGLGVVAEIKRNKNKKEIDATLDAIKKAIATQHEISTEAIALIAGKSIPKTSSGKIQRHACKEMLQNGTLDAVRIWRNTPQKASQTNDKSHAVKAVVSQVLGLHNDKTWSENDPLVQHGMDSLMRQELVVSLEKLIGSKLPDSLIDEKTTLHSLSAYLDSNHKDKAIGHSTSELRRKSVDEIPEEYCNFEKLTPFVEIKQQKDMLASLGLNNPFFTAHDGIARETTSIEGRSYVNFSSYNYIGLSGHPEIQNAAKAAIDKYGTSVSASRLVSGERPLHTALERKLAEFVGVEDAIVFVGGHATNVSTIGHLFGPGDLIVFDSLSHNSILQGNQLSGAKLIPFPHNDFKALDEILSNHRLKYQKAVVIIEGVYSMDGDIPDLRQFVEIKKKHRAFLMVDEAHSAGVLGKTGKGLAEFADVAPNSVDIWMGTLSKAFVSCGGYIAGTKALVEYLRYSAPGFVYSVGMSPPNAASSLKAIELLMKEPGRVDQLRHNSGLFLKLAKEAKLNTGLSKNSPVIPIILGNSLSTLLLSQRLLEEGFNVRPIVYPAVEESAARLRFFITSSHTEDQIRKAIAIVKREIPRCVSL